MRPYIPLPDGLTNPRATAGGVFDRIADLYDRARPGYPAEALEDVVRLCRLAASSRVLEVGCGTGQLTRDLAPLGAAIHALEPGRSLAAIARENLAPNRNVHVITAKFEDFDGQPASYDTVVSATAFHWVHPDIAYAKAAALLRPGGRLLLLTNTHAAGGTHTDARFAAGVRDLHDRLAPEVGEWRFPSADEIERRASARGDIASVWARVERKLVDPPDVSRLFEQPTMKTYRWVATYDRDSYVAMLASQSSYALMTPAPRDELLDGIGRLADEALGGRVTKQYVTVLAASRKRSPTRV